MNIITPLFLGFLTALVGVFPPGIINMTAARISIQNGRDRALLFVAGAILVIFFQTYVSLLFARYISKHQEVIVLLREIGFVVFSILTIYFLINAKKVKEKPQTEIKIKSKRSRFFLGMFISAINFFPIPYYAISSVTFVSFHYFSFTASATYSFVIGVVLGSFLVFYGYIAFFKKIESKADFFTKNTNAILGSITGVIAFLALIQILK